MAARDELTLRGRVLALLASLAVFAAWLTGDDHARLAASLLLAVLLADRLLKPSGKGLGVRVAARQVEATRTFLESWRLENHGSRALNHLRVFEPRTQTSAGGAWIEALPPGGAVEIVVPARTRQRGRFRDRVFVVDVLQPFGFTRRRFALSAAVELVSEPARIELPTRLLETRDPQESSLAALRARDEGEFFSLRGYEPGEDLRFVHAKRSASAGTLLRRVLRSDDHQRAWIVLDLRRPQGRSRGSGGRRFEWSLSAAAFLVDTLLARTLTVEILVLDTIQRTFVVSGEAQAREFFGFLAEAAPVDHVAVDLAGAADLQAAPRCYWIPAGGARADLERSQLPGAVLVTDGSEA